MLGIGMIVFADIRGAVAGGVLSGLFFFLAWRPGGFAYKLEAKNNEALRATGGKAVRWNWLAKQAVVVLAAVAALAVLLLVIDQVVS
jgi:hypothetical protein